MATELGVAYISILPETRGIAPAVRRELGAVERESEAVGKRSGDRFSKGMGGILKGTAVRMFAPIAAAAAGVGVAGFFKDSIAAASDTQEASTKMSAIFGTATRQVQAYAQRGAKALGMTELQASDAAATFGAFGRAAKLTGKPLADFSTEMTTLAVDLASFNNTSPEQAIDALGAALRGEAEPMRAYQVLLDDASMRQEALSMGLIKTTKQALTPQQKILAAHALIMKQTNVAQGDFQRTSEGLANKTRIMSASFDGLKQKVGEMLLPMADWAVTVGVDAVDGIGRLVDGMSSGEGAMAGFRGIIDSVSRSPFAQWVSSVAAGVGDRLMPAFDGIAEVVRRDLWPALQSIGRSFVDLINSPFVGWILGVLEPVIHGFVDGVMNVVGGLVKFITGAVRVIAGIFRGDWTAVWDGAKQMVGGAIQAIIGVFQTGLLGRALGMLRAFGGAAGGVLGALAGWFTKTLPNALGVFFGWITRVGASVARFLGGWLAGIVGRVFTPLRGWFTRVIPDALQALWRVFTSSWNGIQGLVSGVWGRLVAGPLSAARGWFTRVIPAALGALRSVFSTVWNAVLSTVTRVWANTLGRVFTPIRTWLSQTIPGALRVFQSVAAAVWSRFASIVNGGRRAATAAFDLIKKGLSALGTWAGVIVTNIGKTFAGIKAKITEPIKYVVNSIIRDKLAAGWNFVAEKLRLPKWDFAGWRSGGWTGPGAETTAAGIVHADEFVIRKRSQRKLRRKHPGLLDYMNRTGEVPIPGYRIGGRVRGLDPEFLKRLASWNTFLGGRYNVSSGYRSVAEQTTLWYRYGQNPRRVARPGSSKHNFGLAADLAPPTTAAHRAAAARFGLAFPMSWEPWHIQLAGSGSGVYGGTSGGGGFTNPVAALLRSLIGPVFSGARRIIDGVAAMFGDGDAVQMAVAFAKKPVDAVEKWLREKIDAAFPALFADAADEALSNGTPPGTVKSTVQSVAARYGWGAGSDWSALDWIIQRESGWNPGAKNPRSTAFGLFQFLDCVTLDAQILTRRGWLDHDQVRPGDETIGYNPATGRNEWTTIRHVVHKPAQPIVVMRNDRWSARVTPGHRWWTARRGVALVDEPFSVCPECGATGGKRGAFRSARSLRTHRAKLHGVEPRTTQYIDYEGFTRTDELTTAHTLLLSAAADTGDGLPVTDDEALLLGWLAGDGTVRFPTPDAVHLKLWQAKPHRVAEIRELLARIGIPCTEYVRARGEGRLDEHSWYLLAAGAHDLAERSGLRGGFTAMVPRMSPSQRTAWLEGVAAAEGTAVPSGSDGEVMRIPQNDGDVADATVLAAYLSGFRPSVRRRQNQPGFGMITLARPEVHAAAVTVADAGVEDVWCVQTDLGTWTMRQEGQVSLTGNSTWRSVGASRTSDPARQAEAGMKYIRQRYGSPVFARAFWERNGWYSDGGLVAPVDHVETMDAGGILRPGTSLVHNYTGRPETIRTWEQERALRRGGAGTNITINGIRYDSVSEFAAELNFALARSSGRSRYAEVG